MSMLPTLKVTARKTLQENVYDSLKLALMSGEFAPGQQLTVRAITELAGTSPMPVRDAMRRLVAEGALEMQPNGQMRVRLMNLEQRDEAREVRQALEGLALRRAARFVTPEELAEISARDEAMQRALAAGNLRQAIYHNREFHFAIYRAARAPALFQLIEGQWMQNGPFLLLYAETFLATDRQARNARTNHQRRRPRSRRTSPPPPCWALKDRPARPASTRNARDPRSKRAAGLSPRDRKGACAIVRHAAFSMTGCGLGDEGTMPRRLSDRIAAAPPGRRQRP